MFNLSQKVHFLNTRGTSTGAEVWFGDYYLTLRYFLRRVVSELVLSVHIGKHDKGHGGAATGHGNVDELQKFYACTTEFFSFTLLKVEILWKFYLYYTNCTFKCIFEPFKLCFQ
jgi:hypothetical protein